MASQYIRYPTETGGGGSVADINGAFGPSITITGGTGISVGTLGNTITITNTSPGATGTPNTFAGFGALGVLQTIPAWSFDNVTGEAIVFITGAQGSDIDELSLDSDATVTGSLTGLSVNLGGSSSTTRTSGIDIQLDDATSSGGGMNALSINVGTSIGNEVQGPRAIQTTGRIEVNGQTPLISGEGFQIGSRVEHLFTVAPGSPVTGTDSLAVNIAGDFLIEDNIGLGAFGLGASSVGFIASLAVAPTKTIDTFNVFLPAASLVDPGSPTGGTISNMSMIRTFAPVPSGGTAIITNLYGLKIDNFTGPFSAAAINAWGIFVEDTALQNHFGGPVDMKTLQLNGSTSGVLSINAAAVTTSHTLTMPSAQGAASTVLTNNGSGGLSWAAPAATGVTSVTASGPLASSGGTTPNISLTGVVAIANGGTGQTTANAGFNALSPMTTGGDLIYGGASGAGTRLANGTSGQFLKSNGTTLAPSWASVPVPTGNFNNIAYYESGTGNLSPGDTKLLYVAANAGLSSGASSSATGTNATALGEGAVAQGYSQVAVGQWNVLQGTSGSRVSGDEAFIVGSGTGTGASRRDAFSVTNDNIAKIYGTTSGNIGQQAAAATTSYNITWPSAQGASGQTISNNGSGVLSWSSFANTDLSNLSATTAFNQDILPATDFTVTNRNIGSATKRLNSVWTRRIDNGATTLVIAAGNIDVNATNIVNMADPTNPQDAATKAYVDLVSGNSFVIFRDVKSAGTNGGTFTSGAWQTRDLNDTQNSQTWASLSSNVITLDAGTYEVSSSAPCFAVNSQHQTKLRNTSDSTDDLIGSSEITTGTAALSAQSRSFMSGIFTIAGSKNFELQHQTATTQATNGFGVASNFGVSEVYAQIKITKIG